MNTINLHTQPKGNVLIVITAAIVLLMIGIIWLCMWGLPKYNVWQKGLAGEAKLKQAEQEKMILIETAKAEKEAAVLRADAIRTIGEAAQQYPEYRYQEFLGQLGESIAAGHVDQIIYLPTEAGVPLMKPVK